MIVAVIPARSGSKRIPEKNMKLFHGKPIIKYTIDEAIKTNIFDKIIISTNDERIANYARSNGVEVPFVRPKKLSDDFSSVNDVIVHAANWMVKNEWPVKIICCLYATAPMINSEKIKDGLSKLKKGDWDFVLSAVKHNTNIRRSFKINNDGRINMIYAQNNFFKRSQDFEEIYYDAAQFCWGWLNSWIEKKNVYNSKTTIVDMPAEKIIDIDTIEDWEIAEIKYEIFKYKLKKEKNEL